MGCSHIGFLCLIYSLKDPRDKLVRSKRKCIGRSSKKHTIITNIIKRVITSGRPVYTCDGVCLCLSAPVGYFRLNKPPWEM